MKWLYNEFDKYLPRFNYNKEPILYLTNRISVIYVYNFDRKKEVLLTSDSDMKKFRYMSIFEIIHKNWRIIHKKDLYGAFTVNLNCEELPFK